MANKSIGQANVKLTVDGAEEVASKLNEVKTELDAVASAGDAAGNKIDRSFGGVGKRISDSTKGLRQFQGAITGIIGVVGGFAAIFVASFRRIKGAIDRAKESADALNESLRSTREVGRDAVRAIDGFGKEGDRLSQFDDALRQQREAITKANNEAIAAAQKKYKESFTLTYQQEYNAKRELNKDLREINEKEIEQQKRLADAAAKRRAELEKELADEQVKIAEDSANKQKQIEESLADQLESIRISSLDGEERVLEEYQRRRQDREQAYQEAVEAGRQREADLLDAIDQQDAENTNKAIERIREQDRARDEADRNRAQQDQQRQEDKATRDLAIALRELQRSVQESVNAFNRNTQAAERLTRDQANFTRVIQRVGDGIRK